MTEHLITLQQIRDQRPCEEGWKTLLTSLGNPKDLSLRVSIGDIAKSNGAQDALWCSRCITDRRFVVSLIVPAVKRASVHTTDSRVHECVLAVEKWLAGDDSVNLNAAAAAADAAACAAGDVAYAAADVAYAAADVAYAAYNAAYNAACAAADVTYAAARTAAYAAAYVAAAATYAATSATYAAARTAAYAAAYVADAAEQEQQVRDIIALAPLHAQSHATAVSAAVTPHLMLVKPWSGSVRLRVSAAR
jgi:hypothetical protein